LINPYQSLVWSERGRVLQMSGDEAEAVRSYEEAIAAYPGNAYPYFLLGCIYRDRGDTNKAREYFYQADYITPAFTTGLNRYELEPPPTNPPPK
jgi:tetratricopeptide (TPR) repeat protein